MNALERPAVRQVQSVVFRRGRPKDPPRPGEVLLLPGRPEFEGRRDLARLVLERGLDGLSCGEGPLRVVVLGADPSLDDMLAALIVLGLISGRSLPDLWRFADYAGSARNGLYPGTVPLEKSLLGIYYAVRRGQRDLTRPAEAAHFLARWE